MSSRQGLTENRKREGLRRRFGRRYEEKRERERKGQGLAERILPGLR
jgi:hypothetical protein